MTAAEPPGRALLRIAGVLTQVACACGLLFGTIAFVLVQQNSSGGAGYAIGWAVAALAGLVLGGVMARGSLFSVLASAALDAGLGIVLLAIGDDTLGGILRVLSASDVEQVADALVGAAIGMLVVAALCLAAIPQAVRYRRWLRDAESRPTGTTNRGFPPPPVAARDSRTAVATPKRSRRRMYFVLAGFAIGAGAGIGVLVSSTLEAKPELLGPRDPPRPAGNASPKGSVTSAKSGSSARALPDAGAVAVASDAGVADAGAAPAPSPIVPVQALLEDQRAAIVAGDIKGLAATLAPEAGGFGVDADEFTKGPDAIERQLRRDLGELPKDGVTVDAKFTQIGSERNHAWIAQELEVSLAGHGPRRYAVTQLVAAIGGKWTVVAWHWAEQVPDDVAERLAVLGTKPVPKPIANRLEGPKPLDAVVRAAFGSRVAFVDTRSAKQGFNFGSGPNERIDSSEKIKRIFSKLRAEIRLHDGAHVVAASAWDPEQKTSPWIGFAFVNADFTAKTRARTDLTQTFRVLAIALKEGDDWKIVQTQWSHGGPIR